MSWVIHNDFYAGIAGHFNSIACSSSGQTVVTGAGSLNGPGGNGTVKNYKYKSNKT
jgi:hypothetical protein